jgi:phosphoserine phosphatase
MLEYVEHPIAFNPEIRLFNEARNKGWKIVVERKNVVYELEANHGSYVLA